MPDKTCIISINPHDDPEKGTILSFLQMKKETWRAKKSLRPQLLGGKWGATI